jgi:hypothetical protein
MRSNNDLIRIDVVIRQIVSIGEEIRKHAHATLAMDTDASASRRRVAT